jgi:N-acetylglucosaminyl-diphospho-decaprenol L-rhamnosyltransferase
LSSDSSIDIVLSVVIVNYGTPHYVTDCLATLLPQLDELKARVIIVDNNSADKSPEIIDAWLDQHELKHMVHLVRSRTNGGFSHGNNIGIKTLHARNYLLLNSDTLVRPDAIQKMLDTAAASPRAGLISPRLEWPDETAQESCFRFPTPISELCGASQTGIIDRLFNGHIVAIPVQAALTKPQWTSFACALIKDEIIQKVGLMDEKYFMYYEDAEYCHRVRKAGWEIVNQPEARVVHLRGGSSPVKANTEQNKRLPRYYYESRALYFYQTYGWWGLTLANISWEAGRLISKTRQILGRPDKAAIECQWRDIWANWLRPMAEYTHPGLENSSSPDG